MVKCVYLNSDGTIDTYDTDDCKLPHLSGDFTLIHDIIEYAKCKTPSKLPDDCRFIGNPMFYLKISNTNDFLPITLNHLEKLSKFIVKTVQVIKKKQNTKTKSVLSKGKTEIQFTDD